ncbi:MAG: IS3 family transposase [Firmicutes bacterium]|nr:IS3 family transposase [Bacillota bacterium]
MWYEKLEDLSVLCGRFEDNFFNNEQRYQEKLKGLTPIEYRNQALNQLNI